ncbi:MAG: AzlD domain-containing protein [Pseudomonadota bacterium]
MSAEILWTIAGLALGTYGLRVMGMLIGSRLAVYPRLQTALAFIPGCLIVALVSTSLALGSVSVWVIAAACVGVAILTKNLIATLVVGVGLSALSGFL